MTTVRVSVVGMAKSGNANQINGKSKATNGEQLADPSQFTPFCKSFNSFIDDLDTNEPTNYVSVELISGRRAVYIKKIPLANPARVSIFPYP